LDIFGDFSYVFILDKQGYIGYNPGKNGFDKRKIVWYGVWELGWFELQHYEPPLKDAP